MKQLSKMVEVGEIYPLMLSRKKVRWKGIDTSVSTLQTHEITNHKSQKTKVVSSVLHDIIAWQIFAPRKNKIFYISIPKISVYLFKHFYFFCFISTQFSDFASLKIQMQITFAKSFNVLNNAA